MNSNTTFYEQIYNSLGTDFQAHLSTGDLHLYTMNAKGELIKKSCCNGRIWARMTRNSTTASIDAAKAMILDKINTLKQTNNFNSSTFTTANSIDLIKVTALFEIIKIAAARNGKAVSEHLTNYGITDKAQLFEIAKIAAAQDGNAVSENIANYGLTDQLQLYEIAVIAVSKRHTNISQHIANYGLTNQLQRFEVAKIAALNSERNLCQYIFNYDLTEVQRREIAMSIAQHRWTLISEYIANFSITNQEHLFEIAKIAATHGGTDISEHVVKYNLTEILRFEIAKIVATNEENAYFISRYLANYNLTETHRFEIAQIVVTFSESAISDNLNNYDLTGAHRFDIAKIAASRDGSAVSNSISNYKLMLVERLEVSKIAITQILNSNDDHVSRLNNRNDLIKNTFKKFVLYNDTNLFDQFPDLLLCMNKLSSREIEEYAKNEINLFEQFPGVNLLTERELTVEEIHEFAKKSPFFESLIPLIDEICEQTNQFLRKPLVQHLGALFLHCRFEDISPKNLEKGFPAIKELFDIRDSDFRLSLIKSVVNTLKIEEHLDAWKELFSLTGNKAYTPIMCLLLAPLIHSEDKERITAIIKTRNFQDSNFRNPFIKNLEKLVSARKYSLEEKRSILHHFILQSSLSSISLDSLLKNAQNVAFLILLDKKNILILADARQGLDPIIGNIFHESLGLEFIESCADKFHNTFGASRNPDAIFRYAATLMKLSSPGERNHYMGFLREFTVSVLKGTFPSMRYTTENNLHLRTIFGTNSGQRLREEWKKGATYTDLFTSDIVVPRTQERVFDPIDFFRTTILNDNHLPSENYPELLNVLTDPSQKDKIKKALKLKLTSGEDSLLSERISPKELKGIKLMCMDVPFTNQEIEVKIKALAKDLKRLNNLKTNKITSAQLQLIKTMYPDTPPSNQEIKAKMKTLTKALKRENGLKIKKIISLQLQAINLMYPDEPLSNQEIGAKIKSLLKTLNDLHPHNPPEFSKDLALVISNLQLPPATRQLSQYAGWTVSDTDNPHTLLVLGTDVPDKSCQNIDGDPYFAKCLISYLIDGKNRAIVVNDNKGKMRARAIFRLMWDASAGKAVLVLERTYPKTSLPSAIATALNRAAKLRGAALNLDLLSEIQTDAPYNNPISSLDGRASSEYTDAGGGIKEKIWQLENLYYIS